MTGQASPVRLIAYRADGTETDVTQGVQILYDYTVESMDWGSGFFDNDEALAVIKVALACGFLTPDTAKAKFAEYLSNHQRDLVCQVCGVPVRHEYRWDGDAVAGGEYRWFHTDGEMEEARRRGSTYSALRFREVPSDHDVDLWPRHAGDAGLDRDTTSN